MTDARQWRAEGGFTLFEALVALALMGLIMGALASVTGQWLPSWNRGIIRAQRNEQVMQLAEHLADLPDDQREVLLLRHCEGWSLNAVAEHLGRTRASVASLLRRGLKQLRQHLRAGD